MKQKTFKKNCLLTLILAICIGLIYGIITLCSENIFVYAESVPTYSNAELIEKYSTSCIGVNAHISSDNSKYKVENAEIDDLIVQLVPKHYFYTEGSQIGFGDDYGFFITTENKNPTQTVESDMYLSTVLIFSINTESDLMATTDRIIVTVSPEFEYRYICLNGTGEVYIENNLISFDTSTYCVLPYAVFRGGNIEYRQTNNYYLKDISFGGTLLNEQHLNAGDIGYSAYEDYGSYFTALDYEYKGKTRVYGDFPTDEAIALGLDFVDVLIGAVKTVPIIGNVAAGIEEVINIATKTKDVIDLAVGYSDYSSGRIETTEKKITTTCLYQNRKDQLANYKDANGRPALAKVAAITCNTSEDKSLWYGIGDYARAYFTIGHGDGDGVTPYYTRFVDEIALKVVYAGTDKVVEIGKGVNYDKVRSPEYKNIVTDVTENIYLLPEGENHLNFNAKYDSDYTISVNLLSEANIKINGEIYKSNKISINKYIKSGNGLSIDLFGNRQGLTGQVLVCPKAVDNLSISRNTFLASSNKSYLMSYITTQDEFCKLTLNSSSCKIKILDNNLSVLKESDSSSCYFDFKADENYYIQIVNTSSNSVNVLIAKTAPETVSVGNDYTKTLNNSEEYFSVSLEPKQYVLEYTSDDNITYLGCLEQVVISEMTDNNKKINYAFLESGSKITARFGFKGNGTVAFSIKTLQNAYEWEVNNKTYGNFNTSEDARLISNSKLVIRRGTQAQVRLKLGSGYIDDVVQKLNSYNGYSYNNYILYINSDCQLTNDEGSNLLGLLVATNKYEIENLQIQVINDISTIEMSRYSDDNNYGFQFGKISNVSNDEISIEYKTSLSSRIFTDTISNNQKLDISNTISITSYDGFEVTIKKIYITSTGGKTTVYGGSLNHLNITNSSFYFNNYFDYGNGTISSPYILSCFRHLNNVRGNIAILGKSFKLSEDISVYNYGSYWTPIATFKGTFDGAGYHITGFVFDELITNSTTNIGLFGENQENSTIKNLIVGSFYISNDFYYDEPKLPDSIVNIGAIVGINKGTIEDCTAGYLHHYAEVDIRLYCKVNMGTICGKNTGKIRNCNVIYSTLSIASGSVGGVVGENTGAVSGCNVEQTSISCYNWFAGGHEKLYPLGHYGRAGGVAGGNTGTIQLCSVTYNVQLICAGGYYSAEKEDNYSYSPEIGIICGYSNKAPTGCTMNSDVVVDKFDLHVETWTEGAWWWKKTYTHDQAQYVGARAVGHLV